MTTKRKLTVAGLTLVGLAAIVLVLGDPNGVARARFNISPNGNKYYVRPSDVPLPEGPEVDTIKAIVEAAWTLVHEARLERARGQEAYYKELMRQYYSDQRLGPVTTPTAPPWRIPVVTIQPPAEKAGRTPPPTFVPADLNASALEKQWSILDQTRHGEGTNPRLLWQAFGIDHLVYQKIDIQGDHAEVIVDVYWWGDQRDTKASNPQALGRLGTATQDRILLERVNSGWLITSYSFRVLPGYGP